MGASWSEIVILSAIVMVLSYTVTKERLFAALRARLGGPETMLGYLASCPFCASWWIAFVLVPLTHTYAYRFPPDPHPLRAVLNWFLSSALIVAVAAFMRVAFFFVDESQGLVRRQQRTVEVERELLEQRRSHLDEESRPPRLQ